MEELKAWKPSVDDEMTPAVMNSIVWSISDGNPDPASSRRLLQEFIYYTSRWNGYGEIPEPLIRLMRMAFEAYLNDPKEGTLERAIGLRKPKGRPTTNTDRNRYIARDVLRLRLEGMSLEDASAAVSDKCKIPENRVRDIWAKHKIPALDLELVTREARSSDRGDTWTDQESKRLREIYPDFVK